MALLWQGIQLGILLAILVGALLVTLIQASIEQGPRAGLMVAGGIWFSDLLFIVAVYFGMPLVTSLVAWPHFELTLGVVGAIVLLVVGIVMIIQPPPDFDQKSNQYTQYESGWMLWVKGFLINTINPFTVFFWLSTMTGVVMAQELNGQEAFLFFTGIFGTILLSDTLKIFLAKKIKHRLTGHHIRWIRRVSGVTLILFACVLVIRVMI